MVTRICERMLNGGWVEGMEVKWGDHALLPFILKMSAGVCTSALMGCSLNDSKLFAPLSFKTGCQVLHIPCPGTGAVLITFHVRD